ncbi:MAG: LptA/OstA family protein [Verrucomicrobiota bacterium]
MNQSARCRRLGTFLIIWFCTAWLVMASAWAQVGVTKGYKAPLYDPQTGRLKGYIAGAEARPILKTGQLRLINTTATYLNDKGDVALIIEAPESIYNLKDSTITSAGNLTVRSGNEMFSITGTGFLWGQSKTNSTLIISNNVHTVIRRPSNETNGIPARVTAGAAQTFDITAKHFEYEFKSGVALYQGDVVAKDGDKLKLTAGNLRIKLLVESHQVQNVVAEQDVIIDLKEKGNDGRISGAKAVYTVAPNASAVVEVTGNATWQIKQSEGKADLLVLKPKEREFTAKGNANLKLLSRSLLATPVPKPSKVAGAAFDPLEISSGEIHSRPGEVIFRENVAAIQADKMKLNCGWMRVNLTEDNQVEGIVAEQRVVAELRDKDETVRINGERMVYTIQSPEERIVQFTGQPNWATERFLGKADNLKIDLMQKQFEASGNSSIKILPLAHRPSEAGGAAASGATNVFSFSEEPLEVLSEAYTVKPGAADFTGEVRIQHPEWSLACQSMHLTLSLTNNQVQRIDANRNVVMEQLGRPVPDPQPRPTAKAKPSPLIFGNLSASNAPWKLTSDSVVAFMAGNGSQVEKVEARQNVVMERVGTRATGGLIEFTTADQLIRLSDDPVIVTAKKVKIIGSTKTVLILDNLKNTFSAEGPFKLQMPPELINKPKAAAAARP